MNKLMYLACGLFCAMTITTSILASDFDGSSPFRRGNRCGGQKWQQDGTDTDHDHGTDVGGGATATRLGFGLAAVTPGTFIEGAGPAPEGSVFLPFQRGALGGSFVTGPFSVCSNPLTNQFTGAATAPGGRLNICECGSYALLGASITASSSNETDDVTVFVRTPSNPAGVQIGVIPPGGVPTTITLPFSLANGLFSQIRSADPCNPDYYFMFATGLEDGDSLTVTAGGIFAVRLDDQCCPNETCEDCCTCRPPCCCPPPGFGGCR